LGGLGYWCFAVNVLPHLVVQGRPASSACPKKKPAKVLISRGISLRAARRPDGSGRCRGRSSRGRIGAHRGKLGSYSRGRTRGAGKWIDPIQPRTTFQSRDGPDDARGRAHSSRLRASTSEARRLRGVFANRHVGGIACSNRIAFRVSNGTCGPSTSASMRASLVVRGRGAHDRRKAMGRTFASRGRGSGRRSGVVDVVFGAVLALLRSARFRRVRRTHPRTLSLYIRGQALRAGAALAAEKRCSGARFRHPRDPRVWLDRGRRGRRRDRSTCNRAAKLKHLMAGLLGFPADAAQTSPCSGGRTATGTGPIVSTGGWAAY